METEEKFQDFTGFALYDPASRKMLFEHRSAHYFTPASNTKIFTFFASLRLLGDSVPALRYVESGDSLIFWGTADPSFLYKHVYQNNKTFSFLKSTDKKLYLSTSNFSTTNFGSGWAWDDYNDAYSAERSPLPIYGNIFSVNATPQKIDIQPPLFKSFFTPADRRQRGVIRKLESNDYTFSQSGKTKTDVPMKVDPHLTIQLLTDTLKKEVILITRQTVKGSRTLFSVPVDSLYRVMMEDSDNFIAEQLLLACAGVISDTLQPEIAIRYVKRNFLADLADEPSWVDGSGLSRYNLFTPRSIVQLWEKIYQLVPEQRLFAILATGGKSGTIRNWYKADKPYVFGKTGSLSNNHSLSGYLVTRKGRRLIFSYMNNNFTVSSTEVRKEMQTILNLIYEKY